MWKLKYIGFHNLWHWLFCFCMKWFRNMPWPTIEQVLAPRSYIGNGKCFNKSCMWWVAWVHKKIIWLEEMTTQNPLTVLSPLCQFKGPLVIYIKEMIFVELWWCDWSSSCSECLWYTGSISVYITWWNMNDLWTLRFHMALVYSILQLHACETMDLAFFIVWRHKEGWGKVKCAKNDRKTYETFLEWMKTN